MDRRELLKLSGFGALGTIAHVAGPLLPPGPGPVELHRATWTHGRETLQLGMTRQPATGPVALYVHGATFPASMSVGWRMHGVSWLDQWQRAGLDAWSFDFAGYGTSDRPTAFSAGAHAGPPFGRAAEAAEQLLIVLRHIRMQRPEAPIHLIAHSWGTLPARMVSISHPELVTRLVLFGPVVRRDRDASRPAAGARQEPAWSLLTAADQRPRQRTGLPPAEPTPVSEAEIHRWCEAYLDTDSTSRFRTPRSVRVPNGPGADIAALWTGTALVDDGGIRQPTLIIRGEWDHITTDSDAARLFSGLSGAAERRDVKVSGGNHWLHLQPQRRALWSETLTFLREHGPW